MTYGAYDANLTLHGQTSDPYDLVRLVNWFSETLIQPFTAGALGQTETNDVGFIWGQAN